MNIKKITLIIISLAIVTLISDCSFAEDFSSDELFNQEQIELKEPESSI